MKRSRVERGCVARNWTLIARPTWSMANEPSLEIAVELVLAARIADLLEADGSAVEAAEIRRALAERKTIDDASRLGPSIEEGW